VKFERLSRTSAGWSAETVGVLTITKPRQFGTFADACNECGNCDVLCPEDGGPHLIKPLFFASVGSWAAAPHRDGFALERLSDGTRMHARFGGHVVRMETGNAKLRYAGDGFDLRLDLADPAGTAEGWADGPVDLTWLRIMDQIFRAVTAPNAVNFASMAVEYAGAD
jgi:putative selenate reductase